MADMEGYDLRYTHMNDITFLRECLSLPEILKWFPMSNEREIEDAIQCWIGFSRYGSSLTAFIDNDPVGMGTLFLMPYKKVSHHCIFKIVVAPKYQRRGIGSSLIKNLKHLAKNYFKLELIHTEIFEGNPLVSLLKKFDFQEFARQDNYVKDNGHYLARVCLESYL